MRVVRINGVEAARGYVRVTQGAKQCRHRGEQARTMTSNICGSRGQAIPVYACGLHGECTHRQACHGQDKSVRICIGCDDGPWAI
jgi:hypothetical protein